MEISSLTPDQFNDYLELVDQEVRPEGSATHSWEDFPLILSRDNLDLVLGICEGDRVLAGAACLVRQYQTSCGAIPVAGIGSVVTRPAFRGRGLSKAVQKALISRLADFNVPLAVLWTDQPEVYTSQGFVSAGWEFHVDLETMRIGPGFPGGFNCREFVGGDSAAVAALYDRHPFRTLRLAGDADRLYNMPGTRGLVAAGEGDRVLAAVFCGKGGDFPGYVTEWSGPLGLVVPLIDESRRRQWARHLLAPAGAERLAEQLVQLGAKVNASTGGQWLIVQPEQLSRYLQAAGHGTVRESADPVAVLGTVGPDGVVVPGALTVAVWGFDSV